MEEPDDSARGDASVEERFLVRYDEGTRHRPQGEMNMVGSQATHARPAGPLGGLDGLIACASGPDERTRRGQRWLAIHLRRLSWG